MKSYHLFMEFLLGYLISEVASAMKSSSPCVPPLHETVRNYLDSGGQELIHRHMKLPDGVVYNPLLHMSVDHAHRRDDVEQLSELSVLRSMGLHVPGVDSEVGLINGNALRAVTSVRQAHDTVRGTKSEYEVTYDGSPPEELRQAFRFALRIWSDIFPCDVALRVRFKWDESDEQWLAAASSAFSIVKGPNLQSGTSYIPTLAAALSGEDSIPGFDHMVIYFNSKYEWHFVTDGEAPDYEYDFVTTALHELCHGLFFNGALVAQPQLRRVSFLSVGGRPGRFDQFIQMSNGVGIARSCNKSELYQALTTRGLSIRTSDVPSTFMLYAPLNYSSSSVYHLDEFSLKASCRLYNISDSECSDLMTSTQPPGYVQHNVGEQVLRIMRSVLGKSYGLSAVERCKVPAPVTDLRNMWGSNGTIGGNNTSVLLDIPPIPSPILPLTPHPAGMPDAYPIPCVSTGWLRQRNLLHGAIRRSSVASPVLCISSLPDLPCATSGHMLRVCTRTSGKQDCSLATYRDVCERHTDCFSSFMPVSQLSHAWDWSQHFAESMDSYFELTSLSASPRSTAFALSRLVTFVVDHLNRAGLGCISDFVVVHWYRCGTSLHSLLVGGWRATR